MRRLALITFGCAVAGFALGQEIVAIRGIVLDESGKPVAGAKVGKLWVPINRQQAGKVLVEPYKGAVTDEKGAFALEAEISKGYQFPLMAISADGRMGSISVHEPKAYNDLVLRLKPMAGFRTRLKFEESTSAPEYVSAVVWVGDLKGPIIFQANSMSSEIELNLPPHAYSVKLYGKDSQTHTTTLNLEPGSATDLGEIAIKKAILPSLYGKVPPDLSFSEARGLPKNYRLADSRGKWVILEFWGFW